MDGFRDMPDELQLRKFVAPEYIFGAGSRHLAGRYAKNLGCRKALIVSDPGVVSAGWTGDIIRSFEDEDIPHALFTDVSPNPRAEEVMEGAERFRAEDCNAIVAVGGGSPMDCAKGIGIVSTNHRHILEFEGVDQVNTPMPPLVCVPTTGGTSADVSQFAIISNREERVKIAIISKALVPDLSLIDPMTLTTMDSYLTACTGIDALTHAIEAFVSNAHSPMTDLHALEALRLLSKHLVPSVENPEEALHRTMVMQGSLQAGLAFSNAILGANHAMAHSLGGYLDLAHGECNAILLDHVIEFNFPAVPERFDRIGDALGLDFRGLNSGQRKAALLSKIRRIKAESGVNRPLQVLGVGTSDLPVLSAKALGDSCLVTNPRPASKRDLEVIYAEAL